MRLVLLPAGLLAGLCIGAAAQPDPSPDKPRPLRPPAAAPMDPTDERQARHDRAEAAHRLQERTFDDRVRRATSSICDDCAPGPSARRRTRARLSSEPGDLVFDPAQAPALPD